MSGDAMRKKHSILDLVNIIGGGGLGGGAALDEAALRLRVEFPSAFILFPDGVCGCFGSLKKVNGWMDCSTRPYLDYYFILEVQQQQSVTSATCKTITKK